MSALTRVTIDVTPLQTPGILHRGIGRYALALFAALEGLDEAPPITLFDPLTGREIPLSSAPQIVASSLDSFETRAGWIRMQSMMSGAHSRRTREPGEALLFLDAATTPWFLPRASAAIVYDLIPSCWGPWADGRKLGALRDGAQGFRMRRAPALIAISEHSRADAIRTWSLDPKKIRAVPHVASLATGAPSASGRVAALADRPYLVFLGAREPRKGLGPLLERLESRPVEDVHLVVAGPERGFDAELEARLRRLVLAGHVTTLFDVSEPEKLALLAGAKALVFPSRYEGYGLPLVEAMALGTPAVTFRNSSLPEAAGHAGVLVDDGDYEALLAKAVALARSAEVRREASAVARAWTAGMDQADCARRYLEVLAETLG